MKIRRTNLTHFPKFNFFRSKSTRVINSKSQISLEKVQEVINNQLVVKLRVKFRYD